MIPTASDWQELADLLKPGTFRPQDPVNLFETMPTQDAGDEVAAFHLADIERRWDAAQCNKTWQWMWAHHGYRAFVTIVLKRRARNLSNRSDGSKPFEMRIWLAERYAKALDAQSLYQPRRYVRLRSSYDPSGIRMDRTVATAMAGALGSDDWKARHKALCDALKHVRKARETVAFMLPAERDVKAAEAEADARIQWSNEERSADASTRNLEREERRLEREITAATAMKTRNGQIRWFLDSIFRELRTNNCGTTTGLRRLVEMLDPESSVSDDTIGRILAGARKREAKRDAEISAWLAKQRKERSTNDAPQKAAKK